MTRTHKTDGPDEIPLAIPPGIQPVFAAFLDWLHMERRVSPNTAAAYSRDLGNFFGFGGEQFRVFKPRFLQLLKHLHKPRSIEFGRVRVVGPAVNRGSFRSEKDVEGPASVAVEGLDKSHVDGVYIGASFSVDFDGNEILIEVVADLLVHKRLFFHDMTPVTCGVADGEEDQFLFSLRFLKSLFTPGVPGHRIVGVLAKIRAVLPF